MSISKGLINSYKRPTILVVSFFIVIVLLINNQTTLLKFTYPLKYSNIVDKYSKEFNVDPMLVYSIMRAESSFDKEAISKKRARGLMQISEKTGQWGAKELNIVDYDNNILFDPEVNIKIGCWYLNNLMNEFNNDLTLVIAAYNGGSGNVTQWLKDKRYSKTGENLHTIPFPETDSYVTKVLEYYETYKSLYY